MTWSAKQYTRFENERTRPVRDLLAAVPTHDVRVAVDIGCGPGNSTEVLKTWFPAAELSGVDSSVDMVAAARKRLPDTQFEVADIATWSPAASFDVILANAVLHWVPEHDALLPRLVGKLAPGGSLALQMPDNLEEPAHRLMRDVAAQGPWSEKLRSATNARTAMGSASWYYKMLRAHCSQVDVWRTVYHHQLAGGAAAVVEWFKGSGLRPFLDPLNEAEKEKYLERYLQGIASVYPEQSDGSVLLPFPRLFVVATR